MSQNLSTLHKIIVILGPTASGKSALAIKLALRLSSGQAKKLYGINGAEIISADSRQIYREMNIGTAKPTKAELKSIPHHLINIKNPNQLYTVSQYKHDCLKIIKKILRKNKLPILVGGTGLYIKAVVDNLEIPKAKPNPRLRQKLEKELKEKGLNFLYQKLIKLDPEAVYIIDRHNPRRVIRALEITLQTKKPFSSQRKQGKKMFNTLKIGINIAPKKLKERVEKRIDQMINDGLIREVKNLIKRYPSELPVFNAIGYREIIGYIQRKISLEEALNQIKKNTWRYVKRQMTWFKKDKEIIWVANQKEAQNIANKFLISWP